MKFKYLSNEITNSSLIGEIKGTHTDEEMNVDIRQCCDIWCSETPKEGRACRPHGLEKTCQHVKIDD